MIFYSYEDFQKDVDILYKKIIDFNPDALIGCPCGENGFFAVDLDLRDNANGLEAWYELNKQQATPAIPGVSQDTPSGGVHHIFSLPSDRQIKNSA